MTAPSAKPRPLSPHLGIYKPQISSVLSILHRATGVGVSFGLIVLVAWLVFLAGGPDTYTIFTDACHTLIGQILLAAWTWAFFYHLCCGIRHLLWDAGKFLTIRGMNVTGWIVVILSFVMTGGLWIKILGIVTW